jgi:hypothetical protein
VVVAQGAADVGFKRKADEDNQMFDFKNEPRAYDMMLKQYQKNNDVRTKIVAGAEAAVVKAKGLAEAKGMFEMKKAEAFVMRTDANANAIKIEAEAKKTEAEAKKTEAEAKKTEAEAKQMEFELEQKKNAAAGGSRAKKSQTVPDKERISETKARNRLTREQMDNNNRKARERRAEQKKNKHNAGEDL